MIDAFRTSMWEQLDDYVYYIRAIGNLIEFIFGIFLFFNGIWILLFESGGTIRAMMMCIHAYFNIWCQAVAGKLPVIASFPLLTPYHFHRLEDVHQEMSRGEENQLLTGSIRGTIATL